MRALVTGAGGFVGKHLVQHLVESGDEVLGSDVIEPGKDCCWPEQATFAALDVSDLGKCSQLISEFRPEVVYHLAGIAFVPEAENSFNNTLLINVGGTNNVVRACHLLHLGTTIVYVSSAEVYGRIAPEDLPLTENVPVNPANNYSLSKLMGELVTQRYEQFGYVRTIIMRPFNHIGPGQNDRFVVSSFARQLAQIAEGKAPPVLRVGNLEAQRDFSDVRDIVRAYRLAALKGSGVYNLCSGKPRSIESILQNLLEISGVEVEINNDPSRLRPSEVPLLYGSYDKAAKDLGWSPDLDFQKTLAAVYQYWLDKN